MATLSRQVSSGNDDAGETGPAYDPVLGSLPLDGSLEVSFQVQQRLNLVGRPGGIPKLVFPPAPAVLWCENELTFDYIGTVHDGDGGLPYRTGIIDFNNCLIYRKLIRVRGKLTRQLNVNDTAFYIKPDVGSFIPASGSWPTACSTSGWPSGSTTGANTHLNIMFNPDYDPPGSPGTDPYITIDSNYGAREVISVESVNFTSSGETTAPGEATCAIRFTGGGVRIHGDGGGAAEQVWPVNTQVEWIMLDTTSGLEVRDSHDLVLSNYNYRGPANSTPNYRGRFFMHGLCFFNTERTKYRGKLNIANVYGDGFACNGNTDLDLQATGFIQSCGREGISVVGDTNVIVGSPVDSRRPSTKPDSEMLVIRNISRSEIDFEPEVTRATVDNITLQGVRFKPGGNGSVHWAAGAGIKKNLHFIKNDWLVPGELRGGGPIAGAVTIIGNDMAPSRKNPGSGGFVGAIELTRHSSAVIWDNVMPRTLPSPGANPDNYGAMFLECGNISMLGNDFGQVVADGVILIRGSSAEEYKIGQIVGDYPKPYGPGRGRPFPFGADVNAYVRPDPGLAIPSPQSDDDIGVVLDTTGLRLPLGTQLRISAGGKNTGPQVFFTSEYAEQRVGKSAFRCDHGGDAYRDRPAQRGTNQVGENWNDPFPNDQGIPLPPNPLPAGQYTILHPNPNVADGSNDNDDPASPNYNPNVGDWWVVVVDESSNRSYEYINARWDSGGIFHCNWGACYDLDGDGRTTITGVGAGTASGLSQLFGLLRDFELGNNTNGDWIDHPLVTPWDNIRKVIPTTPYPTGFRYPARSSDGANPDVNDDFALFEGTRLLSRIALNLTDCSVRDLKIIHALRVYGFYIMDQGGSDSITFFCSEWGVGALANGTVRTKKSNNVDNADYAGLGIMAHWDGSPRRTATPTTDQGARAGGTPYGT